MSTANNKGAPMNDVELDLAINTILYDFTESDDIVQAANKRLKALFTQEKANLQAALEAELPKKRHSAELFESDVKMMKDTPLYSWLLSEGFNDSIDEVHKAIAAVFNKGDSNGLN